jgi:hypothetical protein
MYVLFQSLSEKRLEANLHKQICKLLNVGHGDVQVRCHVHTSWSITLKEILKGEQRSLTEDMKRFFKLFEESTFDGSRTAAREMKKIAKRQTKHNQNFLMIHGLLFLVWSDSEMLSWPNKQSTSRHASVRRCQRDAWGRGQDCVSAPLLGQYGRCFRLLNSLKSRSS